jgi:hypothetical protein
MEWNHGDNASERAGSFAIFYDSPPITAKSSLVAELRPMFIQMFSVRMYMFSKCYVGFCTPRRTIMDLKKKSSLAGYGQSANRVVPK